MYTKENLQGLTVAEFVSISFRTVYTLLGIWLYSYFKNGKLNVIKGMSSSNLYTKYTHSNHKKV